MFCTERVLVSQTATPRRRCTRPQRLCQQEAIFRVLPQTPDTTWSEPWPRCDEQQSREYGFAQRALRVGGCRSLIDPARHVKAAVVRLPPVVFEPDRGRHAGGDGFGRTYQ